MPRPAEVARVSLGTVAGEFDVRAFQCESGFVYLALVKGEISTGGPVLTRLHSECLTGDALGSLRCDCGVQLRMALRSIAAEGRGVVLYLTGHEGRGIGLVNKLRAYMLQEAGADTVDANRRLGFDDDARDYADAAACLRELGVSSVRLLTNNPRKAAALRAEGIVVHSVVPIPTAAHARNMAYLSAKRRRLGHIAPTGSPLSDGIAEVPDVRSLLGEVRTRSARPYVVLKYAQTLDGRIATRTGDAKWISGDAERRVSHALRASCDAVMVGVGTVLRDDPHLTVRMVPGSTPARVVLDSALRIPLDANVLSDDAATIVITTDRSDRAVREALRERGVGVYIANRALRGVDLVSALRHLRAIGIRSLLVEGGARVITSLLDEGLADRLVVGIAPRIIGKGTEAVGDLHVAHIGEGLHLAEQSINRAGDDLLLAGDIVAGSSASGLRAAER